MNTKNYKLLVLLTLISLITINTIALEPDYNKALPINSGEEVSLFTDRAIYATNETIYFTASYFCNNELANIKWSNILYVELIRWNGEKLSQTKVKLTKDGANGSITIPQTVLSGNYYLRAYTKWMRNYSNTLYGYNSVKIVNPYRSAIDMGQVKENDTKNNSKPSNALNCSVEKKTYKNGENIDLLLKTTQSKISQDYFVAVAKKGSVKPSYNITPKSIGTEENKGELRFLPEIRGTTITGQLKNKADNQPMSNKVVIMSIPVTTEYFSTCITDQDGYFYFTISDYITGSKDFYVQANVPSETKTDILIDNDYCTNPVELPYIPFELDETEEDMVKSIIVDMQLAKAFEMPDSLLPREEKQLFYGSPLKVYLTSKYIDLPNLREFMNEIVQEYSVIKNKNKHYLRNSRHTSMQYLEPLILVDNIPVANNDDVLNLALKKIERIEVYNKLFIAANQNYNGIICIYSRNNDLAGYQLEKNSLFINYDLISDLPVSPVVDTLRSRIPDRRNTLYWNPEIKLETGEAKTISFPASLSSGEYTVFFGQKCMDKNKQQYSTCSFTIE